MQKNFKKNGLLAFSKNETIIVQHETDMRNLFRIFAICEQNRCDCSNYTLYIKQQRKTRDSSNRNIDHKP